MTEQQEHSHKQKIKIAKMKIYIYGLHPIILDACAILWRVGAVKSLLIAQEFIAL